ncbi:MAG: DUF4345 domain-containing protein [Deltaproteobacteria bacterium]|nr:DUF4345 domain-containing protein [Deltaproteobacteria bacterium]
MDRTRIFLFVNALAWLPYGLFCLAQPGFLAEAAGVAATTPTGTTELRAMYGGLQAAIGVLALLAALRGDLLRTALTAIGFLTAGLFLGRLFGAVVDGGWSGYTAGGLAFESALAVLSFALLRQQSGR